MTRIIQYCSSEENRDISDNPHAAQDADEMRVWEEGGDLVLAVSMRADEQWEYAEGPRCGELVGGRAAALSLINRAYDYVEGDEF